MSIYLEAVQKRWYAGIPGQTPDPRAALLPFLRAAECDGVLSLRAAGLSAAAGPPRLRINSFAGVRQRRPALTRTSTEPLPGVLQRFTPFILSSTAEGRGCASDQSSIFCSCPLLAVGCQLCSSHSQSVLLLLSFFALFSKVETFSPFQSGIDGVMYRGPRPDSWGWRCARLHKWFLSCWFRH